MRPIKFRAWHPRGGTEGEPCGMTYWSLGSGLDNSVFFHSAKSVMQFTGLLDKNGKEIYEGDIVKVFNGSEGWVSTQVVWYEHGWGLRRANTGEWHLYQWDYDDVGIVIIGNIYENPELLKGPSNDEKKLEQMRDYYKAWRRICGRNKNDQ